MSDLGAAALHGILSHVVPHLPKIILRCIYRRPEKLALQVAFSLPTGSVQADCSRCELKIQLPMTSYLPVVVDLTHLELDVKLGSARLINLAYSRNIHVKHGLQTTKIELPFYSLNRFQVEALKTLPGDVYLFGFADFRTSFDRHFTVPINELTCHLKPTGIIPGV